MIGHRAYARIGLMGNPSDGFYGKTLSTCIKKFLCSDCTNGEPENKDSSA